MDANPADELPGQSPLSHFAPAEYCITITLIRGTGSKIGDMTNRSDYPKKRGFWPHFNDLAVNRDEVPHAKGAVSPACKENAVRPHFSAGTRVDYIF
jgi:hypothetical protein